MNRLASSFNRVAETRDSPAPSTPAFQEHETGHWEIPINMCDVCLLLLQDVDELLSGEIRADPDAMLSIKDNLSVARSLIVSLKGIQETSFEEEKHHRRERKQYYQLERRVAVLNQYKEKYELIKIEKVNPYFWLKQSSFVDCIVTKITKICAFGFFVSIWGRFWSNEKEMLIKCVEKLKKDKETMKNFFSEQLSKQMMVLNENYEDFFQDEKIFFKHLLGLQNKADYLLDALKKLKSPATDSPETPSTAFGL